LNKAHTGRIIPTAAGCIKMNDEIREIQPLQQKITLAQFVIDLHEYKTGNLFITCLFNNCTYFKEMI